MCSCLPGKEIKLSFSVVVLLFCDLVDRSLPGSTVCGISQARALEWGAISFSRGSSWPKDRTLISRIGRQIFLPYHGATLILSGSGVQRGHTWVTGTEQQTPLDSSNMIETRLPWDLLPVNSLWWRPLGLQLPCRSPGSSRQQQALSLSKSEPLSSLTWQTQMSSGPCGTLTVCPNNCFQLRLSVS